MGRGAKIFLISFLISALAFGLIAFSVISALIGLAAPVGDEDELNAGAIKASGDGSSFNILVINVDYRPEKYSYDPARVNALFGNTFGTGSGGGSSAQISLLSCVILRFDREREEVSLTPIPSETHIGFGDEEMTLLSIYVNLGHISLIERVRAMTGLEIDEYAVIIPSAAESIVNKLGGIEYENGLMSSVSADGEKTVKSGAKTLSGDDVRTLMIAGIPNSTKEGTAVELIKAFLAKSGGDISALLPKLQTSLTEEKLTGAAKLILDAEEFEKKELALIGEYKNGFFEPDIEATINKFSNYRKYYS